MANWSSKKALDYHNATKHSYTSVRLAARMLDWKNYPYPFKVYRNLRRFNLPDSFPRPEGRWPNYESKSNTQIGIDTLAELLFYSAGITRVKKFPGMNIYFRAASATGALYETELYAVCTNIPGLRAGVYHFDPGEFSLDELREGDYRAILYRATKDSSSLDAPLTIVFSSMIWRNAWKYESRSYRHWFWDAGTIAANMLAICKVEGLRAKLITGFSDDTINKLICVDESEEASIALISIGSGSSVERFDKELNELRVESLPLSQNRIDYEIILEAYRESKLGEADLERWKEVCSSKISRAKIDSIDRIKLARDEYNLPELYDVILRRGSARQFLRRSIPLPSFSFVLRAIYTDIPADFLNAQRYTTNIFAIVNSVDELSSGFYYYDAEREELILLRRGYARDIAGYLCLEQNLGSDASAVLFFLCKLNEVIELFGNRGYRICQLEAGIRAGYAYLASYSIGLAATGLTFYDDDVIEFFSPYSKDMSCLLVVALGLTPYRARQGRVHTRAVRHDRAAPIAREAT